MDLFKNMEKEYCRSLHHRRLYTATGKPRRNEVVHERIHKKVKRNDDSQKWTRKDNHQLIQRIKYSNKPRLSTQRITTQTPLGKTSESPNKIKLRRPQTAPLFPQKSRAHDSNLPRITRAKKSYENSNDYVNHTRSNLNLRAKEREESHAKRRAEIYAVNKILKERFDKEFNEFMERKKKEFESPHKEKY